MVNWGPVQPCTGCGSNRTAIKVLCGKCNQVGCALCIGHPGTNCRSCRTGSDARVRKL